MLSERNQAQKTKRYMLLLPSHRDRLQAATGWGQDGMWSDASGDGAYWVGEGVI
jgi:hypothetical protein